MFFWFKRKKIILDCFTTDALTYDRYKPVRAGYHFPEWFKDLDPKQSNLRGCIGFKEFFKNAISLSLWTTLQVQVDTVLKKWSWVSGNPIDVHQHNPSGYGNFLNPNMYDHVKIVTPWLLKTNRYVQFGWVDSFWCRDNYNYVFPNAVVDYFYQHGTPINMFIRLHGDPYQFCIEAGQPLIFLIPLTEEKVKIKTHLVSEQEYSRYMDTEVLGLHKYLKRKKHTDKLLSQQKKCPFGFGD